MSKLEINCDLGESTGNDKLLMPFLDACSVACGGHIGDSNSMRKTIILARKYRVKVGAHPSFPDPKNFGRKLMRLDPETLYESLHSQVKGFKAICEEEGVTMDHIKAHGALYNLAAIDKTTARVMLMLMKNHPHSSLLAPWESVLAIEARSEGVDVRWEGFADRKYAGDRNLVSRITKGAVITDADEAMRQVLSVIETNEITTIDEKKIPLRAHTFCIHGDNSGALSIAKALNSLKHASS